MSDAEITAPITEASAQDDDLSPGYLETRNGALNDAARRLLQEFGSGKTGTATPQEPRRQPAPAAPADPDASVAGAVASDIGEGVVESPLQVVGGALEGLNEASDAAFSLASWANDNLIDLGTVVLFDEPQENATEIVPGIYWQPGMPEENDLRIPDAIIPAEADSVTGNLVRDVSQFLTGFAVAGKAVGVGAGLSRGGQVANAMLRGAIADSTFFDPQEENLSNLLASHTELDGPAIQYLAADPKDSEAEARFKKALEGMGLGLLTDGLALSLRAIRAFRRSKTKAETSEVAVEAQRAAAEEAPNEISDRIEAKLGDADADLIEPRDVLPEPTPRQFSESLFTEEGPEAFARLADGSTDLLRFDRAQRTALTESKFDDLPIRLRRGQHFESVQEGASFGLDHIEARRGDGIRNTLRPDGQPYESVQQFVGDVLDRFNEIRIDGNDGLVLVARSVDEAGKADKQSVLIVRLQKSADGSYWDVRTAGRFRNRYLDKRPLIWSGARIDAGRPGDEGGGSMQPPEAVVTRQSGEPLSADAQTNGTNDVRSTAININLSRLKTPEDVDTALTRTAEIYQDRFEEAARGVQSNDQTQALAETLGMSPQQLLQRRRGQAFNAEEAFAARQILVSSGEQLVELARKANATTATEEDIFAFRRGMAVHAAIQEQVTGLSREAGRTLQAFSIPAGGVEGQSRAIREMLEQSGGMTDARKMAAQLAALDDPAAVNKVVREGWGARASDIFFEAWINGLLSGPQTHAVNALSNSLTAMWMVPERLLAAGIGSVTGSRAIQAGEAKAQAFGMVKGAQEGLVLAWKALRTGEPTDEVSKIEARKHRAISAENLDISGVPGRAVDLLGETVRIPGRLLMTSDEFFKAVGYRMEVHAQAFRAAAEEGLEGEDAARRIAEITANPPENIHLQAVDAARYQTFTKPLEDGLAAGVQRGLTANPWGRLIMPFIRTPVNILDYVVDRSPMAPLRESFRADVAAGGARRDLALARLSLGSMVMMATVDLVGQGLITGGGPSDPSLKSAMRNTGWQPYSIKIGDTYVAYNRLDPIGMTIGLAADSAEIMGQVEETTATEIAGSMVMAVAKNLTSKTYLSGPAELFEMFSDPDRYGDRYIARMAGTLIPTGVAQIERTVDPTLRDARGMLDQIRSRVPGFSEDLPPRRNLWGEPIVLSGGLGPDIVSPIYTSTQTPSPIDKEIVRNQVSIKMPSRTLDGVELTPEEYSRYVELAGNELKNPGTGLGAKETLDALVSGDLPDSARYLEATDGPDGGKQLIIRNVVTAFRQAARGRLFEESPDLAERIRQSAEARAQALGQ